MILKCPWWQFSLTRTGDTGLLGRCPKSKVQSPDLGRKDSSSHSSSNLKVQRQSHNKWGTSKGLTWQQVVVKFITLLCIPTNQGRRNQRSGVIPARSEEGESAAAAIINLKNSLILLQLTVLLLLALALIPGFQMAIKQRNKLYHPPPQSKTPSPHYHIATSMFRMRSGVKSLPLQFDICLHASGSRFPHLQSQRF